MTEEFLMTLEEHNKAVCRRWWGEIIPQMINEHNVDLIDEILAETYIAHPGEWSRDKTKQHWVTYLQQRPVFNVTIDAMMAEGDTVAMRLTLHEGDQAPHFGLAFARLVEGKIVEGWYLSEHWPPSEPRKDA
jgi:predicted SnoaL-like aldol condensation-catalyzing enzyme